jgi:hypothetical protein
LSNKSNHSHHIDSPTRGKNGVISKNIQISLDVRKLAKERWKVDRGYSSGASSGYGTDEEEHVSEQGNTKVVVELPFDPSKIPKPRKSVHRIISEGSCLSELKETIEKDGDLAKTIVRIEVRKLNAYSSSVCFPFF